MLQPCNFVLSRATLSTRLVLAPVAIVLMVANVAVAQVQRLPPSRALPSLSVADPNASFVVEAPAHTIGGSTVASESSEFSGDSIVEDPLTVDPPWLEEGQPQFYGAQPPRNGPGKPGLLQQTRFTGTWLPALGEETSSLGVATLRTSATLGFPAPTPRSPLLITPAFGVHYWDGPLAPEVPARTFDNSLEFRWLNQFRPWLGFDLAVAPGYYSDFDQSNSDAIRITGRAIAKLSWGPKADWLLGVVYLDREDVSLLPAVGLILKPSDATRWELLFPRPRVMQRVACGTTADWWGYLGGEFGGGSWAIRRMDGVADVLTYRDFRVLLGIERKTPAGATTQLELGYVFGRELEFTSDTPDFDADDTLSARGGLKF